MRASESNSAEAVCISDTEYKCQEDEVLHLRGEDNLPPIEEEGIEKWDLEGFREFFQQVEGRVVVKMAGVKTTVKVPEFDRENIQMYLDELAMWTIVTEVEKKKQGPLVWMSLPKNEPSNIKQFINDSIGVADLNKDDGIDKLIEAMKKAFQQEGEIEAFAKWKEFDRVKRKEGEDVRTFVNRFNTAYNAISKKQITIPVSARSFILV